MTRNKFVLKKLSWAGKSSGDCTLDFPSVPFYNSGLYGSMAEDAVYMISDRGAQVGVCRLHRPLPIKMSSTDRVCLTCISQWSYPPLERDLFSSIESGALGGRRCLRALIEFHFPSSPHAPLYRRSRLAHRMCVELDGFRRGITLLIVIYIYIYLILSNECWRCWHCFHTFRDYLLSKLYLETWLDLVICSASRAGSLTRCVNDTS